MIQWTIPYSFKKQNICAKIGGFNKPLEPVLKRPLLSFQNSNKVQSEQMFSEHNVMSIQFTIQLSSTTFHFHLINSQFNSFERWAVFFIKYYLRSDLLEKKFWPPTLKGHTAMYKMPEKQGFKICHHWNIKRNIFTWELNPVNNYICNVVWKNVMDIWTWS